MAASAPSAFLTEVNVLEEFAPPVSAGLPKLRAPPTGEKELRFPEVVPKAYDPQARERRDLFGRPSYRLTGRRTAPDATRRLVHRSRNILAATSPFDDAALRAAGIVLPADPPPVFHQTAPYNTTTSTTRGERSNKPGVQQPAEAATEAAKQQQQQAQKPELQPKKPLGEDEDEDEKCSACSSSRCSCSCSYCLSHTGGGGSAAGAGASNAGSHHGHHRRRSGGIPAAASGLSSRASSVAGSHVSHTPSSLLEGLTSVSQQRSQTSSAAGRAALRLEAELVKEREQRERTERQLQEVQQRQAALLRRMKAAGLIEEGLDDL